MCDLRKRWCTRFRALPVVTMSGRRAGKAEHRGHALRGPRPNGGAAPREGSQARRLSAALTCSSLGLATSAAHAWWIAWIVGTDAPQTTTAASHQPVRSPLRIIASAPSQPVSSRCAYALIVGGARACRCAPSQPATGRLATRAARSASNGYRYPDKKGAFSVHFPYSSVSCSRFEHVSRSSAFSQSPAKCLWNRWKMVPPE